MDKSRRKFIRTLKSIAAGVGFGGLVGGGVYGVLDDSDKRIEDILEQNAANISDADRQKIKDNADDMKLNASAGSGITTAAIVGVLTNMALRKYEKNEDLGKENEELKNESEGLVSEDVKAVQEKLEAFHEAWFECVLTGKDEPDFKAAHDDLESLGKEAIEVYITEKKIPHAMSIMSKSGDLLRKEISLANSNAEVFKPYFIALMEAGPAGKVVVAARKNLHDRMVVDYGMTSEEAEEHLLFVDKIAQKHKERELGSNNDPGNEQRFTHDG